jgi:signal peptidase I
MEDNNINEEPIAIVKKSSKKGRILRDIFVFLLFIIFLLCFRSVVFEPFRIPSGSMLPTLKIGDFIVVNKMSYGIKIPFSDFSYGGINSDPIYLTKGDNIKRGDIIVFKFPKDPQVNYIKRVMGLPGEKLKIINKKIYINGKAIGTRVTNFKIKEEDLDSEYSDNNFEYFESIIEGKKFNYQVDKDNYFKVDHEEVTIPDGHYFVLGDNRDFSYDSRYWGFVPHRYVKGRATYTWLSIGKKRSAKGPSFFFRSNRMGRKIN